MKLIILRTNLIEALGVIERGVGENSNLPILKSFLFKTDGGRIILTSTNLELAVECVVPGKIIESGAVAAPFSVFSSILRNLAAERVAIEEKGGKITVTTDNYEAVIQGQDAGDFPIIPAVDGGEPFKIDAKELREAIGSVITSAQYSEIRPEISGVLIAFDGEEIEFVATDGFRLAERTLSGEKIEGKRSDFSVILPLKTASEIPRVFGDSEPIEVFLDQNQAMFKDQNRRLVSRLIDGKFPDYKAVVPKDCKTKVVLDKQEILNAVKLASTFSGKSNDITIRIGENKKFLEIYAADASVGENNYKVPVKLSGDKFSIVFNWRYILDGLKIQRTGNVVLGFNSSEKPIVLSGEGDKTTTYVAMPIKG